MGYWWQMDARWINKTGFQPNPEGDYFTLAKDVPIIDRRIQWSWAYGFTQTRISDTEATMHHTNAGFDLRITVEEGRAKAYIEMHGRLVWLTYCFVETAGRLDKPQWMLMIGEDVKTKRRVILFLDVNKQKRERAGWNEHHGKDGEPQFYSEAQLKRFAEMWEAQEFPESDDLGYLATDKLPESIKGVPEVPKGCCSARLRGLKVLCCGSE